MESSSSLDVRSIFEKIVSNKCMNANLQIALGICENIGCIKSSNVNL